MEKYVSNSGAEFVILSLNGREAIIQFTETGFVRKADIHNLRAGKVRDLYKISVYGKGYYGEFEKVPHWKQAKQLWQNMLKRCYCDKDLKGYYGKATVAIDWHCFANFLRDVQRLPNFQNWLNSDKTGVKYNLDKDLLVEGNTVYSKETCQFVTEYDNKSAGARNGKPYTKKERVGRK
jgi:hypothetical protein